VLKIIADVPVPSPLPEEKVKLPPLILLVPVVELPATIVRFLPAVVPVEAATLSVASYPFWVHLTKINSVSFIWFK
jgi:hypothetical protein